MLTPRRGIRLLLTLAAVGVATTLAGCTAPTLAGPVQSAPSAAASSVAAAPDAVDCDALLPISVAASTLAVDASTLRHPVPSTDATDGIYQGAIPAAIRTAARSASGAIDCEWTSPNVASSVHDDDGSMPSFVAVSVLPDAATAFAAIEPDIDDGLNDFEPARVGDEGFLACRHGEADQCRVETVQAGAWVSVTISPQPADHQTTIDLAASVASKVAGLDAPSTRRTPIVCDALFEDDEVAGITGMKGVSVENDNELDERANLSGAAADQTGLIACSWSSTDVASPEGFSIVAVPTAAIAAPSSAAGGTVSTTALSPVEGLGGDAMEGCEPDYCEVDVLTDDVWLSISSRGADTTSIDELEKLAVAALTRIPA